MHSDARLNYADLVDIPKLQALLESLNVVTGLANGVLDIDGKIIASTGWQAACTQFHRRNPHACQCCIESDTSLAKQMAQGKTYAVYGCLNGLMDTVSPIVIEGQHVASVFAGQFLSHAPDLDFFREQARRFGFDETKYLDAITRIPVIAPDKAEAQTRLYAQLAATLAENGVDRLRQKKARAELLQLNAELEARVQERTRALSESEERLRLALKAARQGWFDFDVPTGITRVAPEYADMLGYAPTGFNATLQTWLENIHPDDKQNVLAAYEAALECGKISNMIYRRKVECGEWKWIESVGEVIEWDENGKPLRIIGIHKDITERKQMEEETAFLRTLVELSASPMYALDIDNGCRMTFVNRAACEHFGRTREELLTMRVTEWDPEFTPEKVKDFRTTQLEHDALLHFETVHQRKDGSRVPVDVTAGRFSYLGRNISSGFILDITERKKMEEEIKKLAYIDPLTSLPNRRLLLDRLSQALSRAKRSQLLLAVMFLDLDNFKQINDTLGHDVGDALLKEVARRLNACVRAGDTVSRPGGDEFIIVLSEIAHSDDAARVATKIIKAISLPMQIADHTLHISTSVGIAVFPGTPDDDALDLMMKADKSMYAAKRAGGNAYRFFTE